MKTLFVTLFMTVPLITMSPAAAQELARIDSAYRAIDEKQEALIHPELAFDEALGAPKSADRALVISAVSTLAPLAISLPWIIIDKPENAAFPLALGSAGLIVGPSLGYFYAGQKGRALKGLAARSAIAVLGGVVAASLMSTHSDNDEMLDFSNLSAVAGAITVGAIAAGIVTTDALYDIVTVHGRVEAQNRALKQHSSLILAPAYFANSRAYGLGIQITF